MWSIRHNNEKRSHSCGGYERYAYSSATEKGIRQTTIIIWNSRQTSFSQLKEQLSCKTIHTFSSEMQSTMQNSNQWQCFFLSIIFFKFYFLAINVIRIIKRSHNESSIWRPMEIWRIKKRLIEHIRRQISAIVCLTLELNNLELHRWTNWTKNKWSKMIWKCVVLKSIFEQRKTKNRTIKSNWCFLVFRMSRQSRWFN